MIDFNPIFEFSRNNCIGICAFLVPMNLLTTSLTLLLLYLGRSLTQIRIVAVIASIFAFGLFFHVTSWLIIGMVMLPTFILPILGVVCLAINLCASEPKLIGASAQENNRWMRDSLGRVIKEIIRIYPVKFSVFPHRKTFPGKI